MQKFVAVLAAALALACGLAHAQAYRWVDKDGKVRYGDTPPPGVKSTPLKPPAAGAPPPAAGAAAAAGKDGAASKDAKKGPLTPAEQEQAYRERQLKAKEGREKSEKEQAEVQRLKQSCADAQESLRAFERGGRLSKVDPKGETVSIEESERAAREAQMRKAVAETCK